MAMTVTASSSATGTVGTSLKVLVLTGATESGGANNTGAGVSPGQVSVTPAFSNSLITDVILDFQSGTLFTAAANNTLIDNSALGSTGKAFADGNYSGTVTAASAVTVGSSAPASSCAIAAYEVPSSGGSTPSIDASSPVVVQGGGASKTTASFTPPAGAVLVALVSQFVAAGPQALSVTDSSGLTWTSRASVPSAGGAAAVGIWTATVPSAAPAPSNLILAAGEFTPDSVITPAGVSPQPGLSPRSQLVAPLPAPPLPVPTDLILAAGEISPDFVINPAGASLPPTATPQGPSRSQLVAPPPTTPAASNLILTAGQFSPDSILTAAGGSQAAPLSPLSQLIAPPATPPAPVDIILVAGEFSPDNTVTPVGASQAPGLSPSSQLLVPPAQPAAPSELILTAGEFSPDSIINPAGASLQPPVSPRSQLLAAAVTPAGPPSDLILVAGEFSPDSIVTPVGAAVTAPLSPRSQLLAPAAVTAADTRTALNLGASLTESTIDATVSEPGFGGSLTLANFGAAVTLATLAGTFTEATIDAAVTAATLDAAVTEVNFGAAKVGWTMQTATLTLPEFNDVTVNIAITQGGSAFNLTGVTSVDMFFKTAAGISDTDPTTIKLTSTGGSPAITITNAAGGLCTAAVANANLQNESHTFYRIDVVDGSGHRNTCIYGGIAWITL